MRKISWLPHPVSPKLWLVGYIEDKFVAEIKYAIGKTHSHVVQLTFPTCNGLVEIPYGKPGTAEMEKEDVMKRAKRMADAFLIKPLHCSHGRH